MNNKTSLPGTPMLFEADFKRTELPHQQEEEAVFYWEDDSFVHSGQSTINMTKALSQMNPSLKASFKQHFVSFTKQGEYSPNTYISIMKSLNGALNEQPTSAFDTEWIAQALVKPAFHRSKRGLINFFLHWKERDSAAINQGALRLMNNTAACPPGPRNVLSDDPEKSWLNNDEYEGLLSLIWNNYDRGDTGTQVTLIRLLSMQYARRPIQIAHLKIGDIRENDSSNRYGLTGRIVNFPGVKDITAETGFRDSKFEPHPLADHLWNLCNVQRQEVRALYEHTLGFTLTDDQLNKLPLFCNVARIKKARQILEDNRQLNLIENLDTRLFHLQPFRIIKVLSWIDNSPTCDYTAGQPLRSLRPKLPISPRTGKPMVITATRMRHTRARQLARQGVSNHMLSNWLGHTSERSLDAYYNDPAEQARQLNEAMAPLLAPLAMAFAGTLIDTGDQATRASVPTSKLEFASASELKGVGHCGKNSFCATTSIPIPCYRCKHFEPLVDAPHREVLEALEQRQAKENQVLTIGGPRNLLLPIDLSADIRAVANCIARCNARKAEREINP